MGQAPVCHVPTDQVVFDQPHPVKLPSIPQAIDLPSALAAINTLRLLVQMLAGQQQIGGPAGSSGLVGRGGGGFGTAGAPGKTGNNGNTGKDGKVARYQEDRSQRVTKKIRVFQDNDKTSSNYVDINQINRVVWVDKVTGQSIVWSR